MTAGWKAENPPKDGTPIVVCGRVIYETGVFTDVDTFCAAVRWCSDSSGEGWRYEPSGMTVERTTEERVVIDWWIELPFGNGAAVGNEKVAA